MRLTWQMLFHAKPKLRIRAHAQAHPKDHVGFRHSTAPFPDVFIDLAVLADPQTLGAFDSIMDSLKTAFFFFFFFFFSSADTDGTAHGVHDESDSAASKVITQEGHVPSRCRSLTNSF